MEPYSTDSSYIRYVMQPGEPGVKWSIYCPLFLKELERSSGCNQRHEKLLFTDVIFRMIQQQHMLQQFGVENGLEQVKRDEATQRLIFKSWGIHSVGPYGNGKFGTIFCPG